MADYYGNTLLLKKDQSSNCGCGGTVKEYLKSASDNKVFTKKIHKAIKKVGFNPTSKGLRASKSTLVKGGSFKPSSINEAANRMYGGYKILLGKTKDTTPKSLVEKITKITNSLSKSGGTMLSDFNNSKAFLEQRLSGIKDSMTTIKELFTKFSSDFKDNKPKWEFLKEISSKVLYYGEKEVDALEKALNVYSEKRESIEKILTKNKDLKLALAKIDIKPGDIATGRYLYKLMGRFVDMGQVAKMIANTLKVINVSVKDYLNNTPSELQKEVMKGLKGKDNKTKTQIFRLLDYILMFERHKKDIEPLLKKGGAEHITDTYERKMELKKEQRRRMLNVTANDLRNTINKVWVLVNQMAQMIGSDIHSDANLIEFIDAYNTLSDLEQLKNLKAVSDYTDDLKSREYKNMFLQNLDIVISRAKALHCSDKGKKAVNELIRLLESFVKDVKEYSEAIKGGEKKDYKLPTPTDFKASANNLKHFYKVGQLKDGMSASAKILEKNLDNFETILTAAMSEKMKELDLEADKAKKIIETIYPKESKPEDYVRACDFVDYVTLTKKGLYSVAEALEIYLKEFNVNLLNNYDDLMSLQDYLEPIQNMDLTGTGYTIANIKKILEYDPKNFSGIDDSKIKEIKDNLELAKNEFVTLKNVMSLFIGIGDKFGNQEIKKKTTMTVVEMWERLSRYMMVNGYNLFYDDENDVEASGDIVKSWTISGADISNVKEGSIVLELKPGTEIPSYFDKIQGKTIECNIGNVQNKKIKARDNTLYIYDNRTDNTSFDSIVTHIKETKKYQTLPVRGKEILLDKLIRNYSDIKDVHILKEEFDEGKKIYDKIKAEGLINLDHIEATTDYTYLKTGIQHLLENTDYTAHELQNLIQILPIQFPNIWFGDLKEEKLSKNLNMLYDYTNKKFIELKDYLNTNFGELDHYVREYNEINDLYIRENDRIIYELDKKTKTIEIELKGLGKYAHHNIETLKTAAKELEDSLSSDKMDELQETLKGLQDVKIDDSKTNINVANLLERIKTVEGQIRDIDTKTVIKEANFRHEITELRNHINYNLVDLSKKVSNTSNNEERDNLEKILEEHQNIYEILNSLLEKEKEYEKTHNSIFRQFGNIITRLSELEDTKLSSDSEEDQPNIPLTKEIKKDEYGFKIKRDEDDQSNISSTKETRTNKELPKYQEIKKDEEDKLEEESGEWPINIETPTGLDQGAKVKILFTVTTIINYLVALKDSMLRSSQTKNIALIMANIEVLEKYNKQYLLGIGDHLKRSQEKLEIFKKGMEESLLFYYDSDLINQLIEIMEVIKNIIGPWEKTQGGKYPVIKAIVKALIQKLPQITFNLRAVKPKAKNLALCGNDQKTHQKQLYQLLVSSSSVDPNWKAKELLPFTNEDEIFKTCIKAMFAKVQSTIGIFSIFNNPEKVNCFNPQRVILGGNFEKYPETNEKAIDLYIRLPLYVEVYKYLFINQDEIRKAGDKLHTPKEPLQRFLITFLPEMSGTPFGNLFHIMWRKIDGSQTYTDNDVKEIISEINKIYDHYKTSNNLTHDVITDLVRCVNERYGKIKGTEIKHFKEYIKEESEYEDTTNNYDILDGNYALESAISGIKFNNRVSEKMYDLKDTKVIVDEFLNRVNMLFRTTSQNNNVPAQPLALPKNYKEATNSNPDNFRKFIENIKHSYRHSMTEKEKYETIKESLQSCSYRVNNIAALFLKDFVEIPLKNLYEIQKFIKSFDKTRGNNIQVDLNDDNLEELIYFINTGLFTLRADNSKLFLEWTNLKQFVETSMEYIKRSINILRHSIDESSLNDLEKESGKPYSYYNIQKTLYEQYILNKPETSYSLKDLRKKIQNNNKLNQLLKGWYESKNAALTRTDSNKFIDRINNKSRKQPYLNIQNISKHLFDRRYIFNIKDMIENAIFNFIQKTFDHNTDQIYSKLLVPFSNEILNKGLKALAKALSTAGEKTKLFALESVSEINDNYKYRLNGYLPYFQSLFESCLPMLIIQKELLPNDNTVFSWIDLVNSIITNIKQIIKELDDIRIWGNTKPNYIEEYKRTYNSVPFGSLGIAQNITQDLHKLNFNSSAFKILYATRETSDLSNYPSLNQQIKTYNESYQESFSNDIIKNMINIYSQFREIKIKYCGGIDVSGLNYFKSNNLEKNDFLVDLIEYQSPTKAIVKYTSSSATRSSLSDRRQAIIHNIMDLNIMPINIYALYSQIPFLGLYTYAYNSDQMIKDYFDSDLNFRTHTSSIDNNSIERRLYDGDTRPIKHVEYPYDTVYYSSDRTRFMYKYDPNARADSIWEHITGMSNRAATNQILSNLKNSLSDSSNLSQNISFVSVLYGLSKENLAKILLEITEPRNNILKSTGILLYKK